MRTTIDLPDGLAKRVRPILARRGLTLRAVVIDALERLLVSDDKPFVLRDASVGPTGERSAPVRNADINALIDELRGPRR